MNAARWLTCILKDNPGECQINKWRVIRDIPRPGAEGLALDEALLTSISSGLMTNTLKIYYFSPPSAILGIHQSVDEVDLQVINHRAFELNRRLTGGGAILLGSPSAHSQMGMSIVIRNNAQFPPRLRGKFDLFTNIIANAIRTVGLDAKKDENFNIVIGGKKVAGCGIYAEEHAVLFHAMVLLDCDYTATASILRVPPNYPPEQLIHSMQNKITTLKIEYGHELHHQDFETIIIKALTESTGAIMVEGQYSDPELKESRSLVQQKYSSKEWIFGSTEIYSTFGACFVPTPSSKD